MFAEVQRRASLTLYVLYQRQVKHKSSTSLAFVTA